MGTDSPASTSAEIASLVLSGEVLHPGAPGYDLARRIHNGLIDKYPKLIARSAGTADVVDAVNYGRDQGLEIAIRGGGHNVAGRSTVEGGLMIDLSAMRGVYVDARACVAHVQGGATWALVNRETQIHGLAVTGGVISSTGVAGLTLGGGIGWLMSKYGLALDNLVSAELVTAQGKVVRANAEQYADLFWAIRGGGGNFGVATSFEFKLHPVGPMVTGGLVAHPFPKAQEMLRFFRDRTQSLPDEMTLVAALTHAPDGSGMPISAIAAAHFGSLAEGAAAVKPIKDFGPPIMDVLGPIPYTALNGMLDAGYPRGALNYWKSAFLKELSDGAIDTMVACFARCPTPMSGLLLEHFHGAVTRIAPTATAFPHRQVGYNLLVLAQWMDPAQTSACIAWCKETYETLRPFMADSRYVNYLGDDEMQDQAMAAAYGPNQARLRQIKAKYDPDNLFHLNQNIRPG
ncbi:FAD-binding oxidoreductase [Mesorhizobium sp. WSM4976]|uniref:FAD-binding oxidoreductase n=1 Tax=Mesorhizobium sp. WSM4976 TaxID=3038549 RepID=UPI0024177EA1|nr:FAD-binding oxidoreductase [Mesorhizobium sp. WSM4976]MDG4892715.1 FAD-binding oxidoreductase [Mesorhizobium sp. WSM4976]